MRIGNVAMQLGIGADWIRRLERKGRISKAQRDCNGHRRYRPEDVEILRATIFGQNEKGKNS